MLHESALNFIVSAVPRNPGSTILTTLPDVGTLTTVFERYGTPVSLTAGSLLFAQGSSGRDVYFLISGQLSVENSGGLRTRLESPEVVGEFAFIDNRPRSASVRAIGGAQLLRLDRETLLQQLGTNLPVLNRFLQALSTRMNQRTGVSEPETETDEAFLDRLTTEALEHRAVNHPYLLALASGDLPDIRWSLADFAGQYLGYSAHFPRYLATVVSRLSKSDHRRALMENLVEESGTYADDDLLTLEAAGIDRDWIVGIPHPELFRRFCAAVGATPAVAEDDSTQVVCWREMLLAVLSGGTPAEALGALGLGTEAIISTMYNHFLPALERAAIAPRDAVFFPLHTVVDDHHQASLREIALDYARTPAGRQDLHKGMHKALFLRVGFWDWMLARAQERSPVGVDP